MILIPVTAILLLFFTIAGAQNAEESGIHGWRGALLKAFILAGAFTAIQSEVLSLFHGLTALGAACAWLGLALLTGWFGLRKGWLRRGWQRCAANAQTLQAFDLGMLAACGVICGFLLVVLVVAPPNNTDSLQYHMSRVAHWAQNRSIAHFPAAYIQQVAFPVEAEAAILQLRLLWGDDRLAGLPQWFSLILCAAAVSLGAGLLGAGRKGQWAAAAFSLSIPVGLLQATSNQNDYVTALFLVIVAVWVLAACQAEAGAPGWSDVLFLALTLGLGMMTKGTFYPYVFTWGLWLIFHWLRQREWKRLLLRAVWIGAVIVLLNGPTWGRNLVTYGTPLGSAQMISSLSSIDSGLAPYPANLVKDIALNLATPSPRVNAAIVHFIQATFQGIDPKAANFQLVWRWNHEDWAGSPVHLLLSGAALLALLLTAVFQPGRARRLAGYSLTASAAFFVFAAASHFEQFGGRFQLPLFVTWAPVVGAVFPRRLERWLAPALAGLLVLLCLPYVLFNTTRPLIALKNTVEPYAIHPLPGLGKTMASSIFYANAQTLLFANWKNLQQPYAEISSDIRNSGCRQVGLRIDSHDIEYAFWWLLDAPQSGIRIESLYYPPELSRYADPAFTPCAVICTICANRTRLHGLSLAGSYDSVVELFMGGTYSPEPGP